MALAANAPADSMVETHPREGNTMYLRPLLRVAVMASLLAGYFALAASSQEPSPPVKVVIKDEKSTTTEVEPAMPVDPAQRIQLNMQGNFMVNVTVENKMLHLGYIQ